MATENNCCSTIYLAKCVKYTGTTLSIANTNDTLDTILANISGYVTTYLNKTYDISCLPSETSTTANLNTTVQAILDEVCAGTVPTFDATCLGGSATATHIETTALLITRVCSTLSPSFDATCLGGTASDSLETTVNALITRTCTPTATVSWGCLTAAVDNEVDTILQALIDNLLNYAYEFSTTWFSESADPTCGTLIAIDETKLVNEIKDNTVLLEAINTYVTNNIEYKTFKGETCTKNFLADTISVGEGLSAAKTCYALYSYRMDVTGLVSTAATLESITLPSGVKYTVPSLPVSDPAAIQTWLTTNLDITSASVSTIFVNPTYTLRVVLSTHGNSTDFMPKVEVKNSNTAKTVLSVSPIEAILVDAGDTCCTLHIEATGTTTEEEVPCPVDVVGSEGIDVSLLTTEDNTWQYNWAGLSITDEIDYLILNGKTYTAPLTTTVNSFTAIQSWLEGIAEIDGASATGLVTGATTNLQIIITAQTNTVATQLYPVISIEGTEYVLDILSFGSNTCTKFHVQQTGKTWENVVYGNANISGDLKYRVIGDRVEVRGGTVTYSNLASLTATNFLDITGAFTIPFVSAGGDTSMSIGANHSEVDGGPATVSSNYDASGSNVLLPHNAKITNLTGTGSFDLLFHRMSFDSGNANAVYSVPINSTGSSVVAISFKVPSFTYYI